MVIISEAFRFYAQDVIVFRNQSKKTEENHYVCMKALLVFFGDVPIESLNFQMVRLWKQALERSRSPQTVRNYMTRLRVVLAYLHKQGMPVIDPETLPLPKRGDRVPDFITKEDVAKLIEAVSRPAAGYVLQNRHRNALIISMLYASGIRVSELCGLDRADIREDGSFTVIGKGSRARLCFLDERSLGLLKAYLTIRNDNQAWLLISSQNGLRMTPGGVQEVFRLARKKAGFNIPVHPHTLRHSFATDLLRNNANIRYVQAMLGHRSLDTTMQYTHVVDQDLHRVYREYHKT